jgi:hypothetical protein
LVAEEALAQAQPSPAHILRSLREPVHYPVVQTTSITPTRAECDRLLEAPRTAAEVAASPRACGLRQAPRATSTRKVRKPQACSHWCYKETLAGERYRGPATKVSVRR